MATGFTSPEIKENTMSKVTSSAAMDAAVQPIEAVSDVSGLHDEINSLNNTLANNSSGLVPTTVGAVTVSKNKKKHRRGKPKTKNTKPYKKTNWKFQVPRYGKSQSKAGYIVGGSGSKSYSNSINVRRPKLNRSRSLVPYNTNKFLMEEHLAEMPSVLLTPSGRTRDSSFSVDSEDNYFYSLPEDEEEFLTKEFSNVYEKARVERLEMLTKQQLISECLQIEDRYSEQGAQGQQLVNVQKMSADFLTKIRQMEEKIRDLTRENNELRRQLATATALTKHAASSSEDSESDSSSSSSSKSSKSSSFAYQKPTDEMIYDSSSSEEVEQIAKDIPECNGYSSGSHVSTPTSTSSSMSYLDQRSASVNQKESDAMIYDSSSSEYVENANDNTQCNGFY